MVKKSEDPAIIKQKVKLIPAYRVLAGKQSEMGDHTAA
jgi:hypothetical protein